MKSKLLPLFCLVLLALVGRAGAPAAGSNAPRTALRLAYPTYHVNFYSYQSTLYLANSGSAAANVHLSFSADPSYSLGPSFTLDRTIPAAGSLVLPSSAIPNQARGLYSLAVSSDQPLEGVLASYNALPSSYSLGRLLSPDLLRSRRLTGGGAYVLACLPLTRRLPLADSQDYLRDSSLQVMNASSTQAATTLLDFYAPDGQPNPAAQVIFSAPPGGVRGYLAGSDGTQLPVGEYLALVTTNQPALGWLIHWYLPASGSLYTSTPPFEQSECQAGGSTQAGLARAYQGGAAPSQVYIGNLGTAAAQATVFFNLLGGGNLIQQYTIPAAGFQAIDLAQQADLPAGTYAVRVAADQPALLFERSEIPITASSTLVLGSYALRAGEGWSLLPYVDQGLYPNLDGSTTRVHSQVWLQNMGSGAGTASLVFYRSDGSLADTQTLDLPVGPPVRLDTADLAALANGFQGSVRVSATQPLNAVVDVWRAQEQPVSAVQITSTPPGPVSAGTAVGFRATASGSPPFSYAWSVSGQPAGTDSPVFTYTFETPGSYPVRVTVSNTISQQQAEQVMNVDPLPPGTVRIQRLPEGDVYPGDTVHFGAIVETGTPPFTYTWSLESQPAAGRAPGRAGERQVSYQDTMTYTVAPDYDYSDRYSVAVTVTNSSGWSTDRQALDVARPPQDAPDLSGSSLSLNPSVLQVNTALSYTLILRNRSTISTTAVLTDDLQGDQAYLTDSARASSGTVTAHGRRITWVGQVISGTPAIVEFVANVGYYPVGTLLENTALVQETRSGQTTRLQASVRSGPGYGLSINDGQTYTHFPTVTLGYSWNPLDPVTQVRFSNDSQFSSVGGATGWLAINAGQPQYPGWRLAPYGSLQMPRRVYVQFRDAGGQTYGPFQSEIVYDPGPPQIERVEILPVRSRMRQAALQEAVRLRVTTRDSNSGVGWIQVSDTADFGVYQEYASRGAVTEITWDLPASGEVYVRVVDRAGNLSPSVHSGGTPTWIVLPLVARHGP